MLPQGGMAAPRYTSCHDLLDSWIFSGNENLVRDVYEGVAHNIRWIVEIVEKHYRFPLPTLRVIGGAARSEPWMQILSDVTFRRVETVRDPQEAGAVGARNASWSLFPTSSSLPSF